MEHPSAADLANQRMVDCLIAAGALWSPALIAAFRATPRHRFLDRVFQLQPRQNRWREIITRAPDAEALRLLYSDRALITHISAPRAGQVAVPISSSSQPSLMALMLEDLNLRAGQRVLEIGAGTGYNAALLAHVVGPGCVTSVDVDRQVLSETWDHLRAFPDRAVHLHHGDGRNGWPAAAPYDRLLVTAATPRLEPAWLEQVREGGVVSAPTVLAPGLAFILCGTVRDRVFEGGLKRAAYFMGLRAEGESGADDETPAGNDQTSKVAAPWADWADRHGSRSSWLRFAKALALYGWVRGLTVHYRGSTEDFPLYSLADGQGNVCWYGSQQWHVSGAGGLDLGEQVWRHWLAAGGPWPTEWRVSLAYQREPAANHPALSPGVPGGAFPEAYDRQEQGGWQHWALLEERQRGNWL